MESRPTLKYGRHVDPAPPRASAWQLLERSLTRLVRLRELGAPADILEKEVALAKRWWSKVPLTAAGGSLVWPERLLAVAQELGFEPDARGAGPSDPEIAAGVAAASAAFGVVMAVTRAIESSGGVEALHVVAAGRTVHLHGTVSDDDARDRVGRVAARAAPHAVLNNQLVVRSVR